MRSKRSALLAAGTVSLGLVAALHAGGWAVVTVRDLPEHAVAGTPLELTFMVRQHGLTPLGGLEPTVAATSGTDTHSETVKVSAIPTRTTGEYRAALVLPRPGRWTIRIDTVTYNEATLHELAAIAPGSPAPPPLPPAAAGERLFTAKGCIGCHLDRDVQARMVDVGPELTGRRFPDAYLERLLADPTATLGPDAQMPDLELTVAEVAALTAFINRPR